jgi:dihydropyrimidine dehydrogenase (NAD+) subunit PreA
LRKKHPTKVQIASIMAPVIKEEWQNLVLKLNDAEIDAFELNFSCPHGMPEKGIGMAIGTNPEISSMITKWVKEVSKKPVFVKLSPNVTSIVEIAQAVEKAGADGFTAINTVQSLMSVNLDTFEPNPNVNGKSTFGGYSGIAVKPIGLRCVAQIRQNSNLPILGTGGVSDWQSTAEYITVGADVVQVCTEVMINGYGIIKSLKDGLLKYLESKNFNSPSDIKNKAIEHITTHETLFKSKKACPFIDNEKCIKCQRCVLVCQESEHSALSLTDGKIVVDKNKCVGCSLCSHACPKTAISMKND